MHAGIPPAWIGRAEGVLFGANHWLATGILGRLLSHPLCAAGLLTEAPIGAGDLFRDSLILCRVTKALPAVRIVVAELKAVGLAEVCEVGWHDLAEDVWRTGWPVPPPAQPFDRWLADESCLDRQEALLTLLRRTLAAVNSPADEASSPG